MRDEVLDELVSVVAAVDGSVPAALVREVLAGLITQEAAAVRLQVQLAADPEMLTSGSPRIPILANRIQLALRAAGSVIVRPPACGRCGRVAALVRRDGEKRICEACGRELMYSAIVECVECGQAQHRHAKVGDLAFCRRCWLALQSTADERLDRFVMAHVPGGNLWMMLTATERLKADRLLRLAFECELFGIEWIRDPSQASRLFAAFYDQLRALGATLPGRACGVCGLIKALSNRVDGRICCDSCYRAEHKATCDGCGQTATIESRRPDGTGLCQACVNQLEESWADCVRCGHRRLIAARTPEGAMCSRCRTAPAADVCTVCGATGDCRFPGTAKAICARCYMASRIDVCGHCGQEHECRFAGTLKAVCPNCARRKKECAVCGRVRILARRTPDGAAICWGCVPPVIETCTGCGRDRRVHGRPVQGPLCQSCVRTSPAMFRDCLRCGTHGRLHHRRWCDRCYADNRIRDLLPDELLASEPRLVTLRESFLAADARRTLDAFRRKSTVEVLRSALSAPEPLSHELLDTLGSDGSTAPVRALLVEHGLLPVRDEQLVRFEDWCRQQSERLLEPEHRRLFEGFVRWRHLRQLRAQTAPVLRSHAQGRREELAQVWELLDWLTRREETTADMDQAHLDLWLQDGPTRRRRVTAFLQWAAANTALPRLRVPPPKRTANTPTGASVDERWEMLGRILAAQDADPRTQLAGALLLLFGIPVSRLHQLHVTDIDVDQQPVTIRLGSIPLELPAEIGEIAIAAHAHRDAPRLLTDASEEDWLFPGQRHGTALSRDALTSRLAAFGIRARHARAGTLAALAQEVPAPVIARLTGLHITAATRWAEATVASNARYSALKR